MPRSLLAKPLRETQPMSGLATGVTTLDRATLRQSLNQNQVTCKRMIGVALVCISWESGPQGRRVSGRWWWVLRIDFRKGSKATQQWQRSLEAEWQKLKYWIFTRHTFILLFIPFLYKSFIFFYIFFYSSL